MSYGKISRMFAEAREKPGEDVEAVDPSNGHEYLRVRQNDLGTIDTMTISGVISGVTFSLDVPDNVADVEWLSIQVVQAVREAAARPASELALEGRLVIEVDEPLYAATGYDPRPY